MQIAGSKRTKQYTDVQVFENFQDNNLNLREKLVCPGCRHKVWKSIGIYNDNGI